MLDILTALFSKRRSKKGYRYDPATIPKATILEVGYFTTPHVSLGLRPDDGGWQSRFSHFEKIRPLQQAFTKCVKDAVDGIIPQRTFFFASGTNGGKTHAIVEAAINTCAQPTPYSTLIIAPQRNVVEDICRGHFSKLTDHTTGKTVRNVRLDRYENSTDNGHIIIGGDIVIGEHRKVRWCMFCGHGDIHELEAVHKNDSWMEKVDIFIGTVDAFYIKPLPGRFLENLRCVFIDEVHMFRNSLGENTSYLLRMLHVNRNRRTDETYNELVIGMATATCGNPEDLATEITKRPKELVVVVADDAQRKYTSIYRKNTLRNETCDFRPKLTIEGIHSEMCKIGDVGNLMVFYEGAVDVQSQIIQILNRGRNEQPPHSSTISFHDSKHDTIRIEARLRAMSVDHHGKYFSYSSTHAKLARVLRTGDASGKTMIATSAGSIGQHIPNTCIVCIELCPDHEYLLQAAGRGGRDCVGIALVRCKPYDSEQENLTAKVVDDPGKFFNRIGRRTAISDSPSSFYKNSVKYLSIMKRDLDDNWKGRFLCHMYIPESCRMEAEYIVEEMDIRDCIDYFKKKFAEINDIPHHQIKSALTASRMMNRVIEVFEDGVQHKTTLAHITTLEAFKNYFPGSLNPDVYEPHKTVWKWQAVNCLMKDGRTATIDDIISIVVTRIDKGSMLPTQGCITEHDPEILSPTSEPWRVDITLPNGKQHHVQIQNYKAQQIWEFDGYTHGHLEKIPDTLAHSEIDNFEFWKPKAKHVVHMEAVILICVVSTEAVGREPWIKDAIMSRIEDIFYASKRQIFLDVVISKNTNSETFQLAIRIIEKHNDYNVCNGLTDDDNVIEDLFRDQLFSRYCNT